VLLPSVILGAADGPDIRQSAERTGCDA
jgi:hypothetical protein